MKGARATYSRDLPAKYSRGRLAQKITPHWQDLHNGVGGDTLRGLANLLIVFTSSGEHLTRECQRLDGDPTHAPNARRQDRRLPRWLSREWTMKWNKTMK